MNILFVFSLQDVQSHRKPLHSFEQMQFGISYISALLRKADCETRLIVLSRIFGRRNKRLFDDCMRQFSPRLICFTSISTEYEFIESIARYAKKKYPSAYLLLGGCHVSLNAEDSMLDIFDALCIGEGEYPVFELVEQMKIGAWPTGIANLWIRKDQRIEKNPVRPLIENLDQLPFPDRDMWVPWVDEEPGAKLSIMLGRGCPFECTYCCNYALKNVSKGNYVRLRTPEKIIAELKEMIEKYPWHHEVYLEVESFGLDRNWAMELCEQLKGFNESRKVPLSFGVNLRIAKDPIPASFYAACKRANIEYLNIGLESGSERVRRESLGRYYSNEEFFTTVSAARGNGLKIRIYNMIGIPGETVYDFQQTMDVNKKCMPENHITSIFYPYPGTKLYSICVKMGLLRKNSKSKMERLQPVIDLPGFSRRQVTKAFILFDFHLYLGKKSWLKLILRIVGLYFRMNPYRNLMFHKIVKLPPIKKLRQLSDK